MSQNSVPPSPTQGLTNQATIDFLEGLDLPLDQLWLAWSITHANGNPGWRTARYSRAVVAAMPANQRHHVSSGLYPPGTAKRDDHKDLLGVWCICFDDVGDLMVIDPVTGKTISHLDIALFELGLLPPETWSMETSAGNHQFVFQFDPVLTSAEAVAVINLLKLRYGSDVIHSRGQYLRTPTGINSKRGNVLFPTKFRSKDGPKYTYASFLAAIGSSPGEAEDLVFHRPKKAKASNQTCSERTMKVLLDALDPNDGLVFKDHNNWIGVAHAIQNTLGEAGEDLWLDWSNRYTGRTKSSGEALRVWETLGDDHVNDLNSLRKYLIETHGEPAAIVGKIKQMIADDQAPLTAIDPADIPASVSVSPDARKDEAAKKKLAALLKEARRLSNVPPQHANDDDDNWLGKDGKPIGIAATLGIPQTELPTIFAPHAKGQMTMLAGPPGKGKSLLALAQGMAIIYDDQKLLRTGNDRLRFAGDVFYFCNEDALSVLRRRADGFVQRHNLKNITPVHDLFPLRSMLLSKTGETTTIECLRVVEAMVEHIKGGRAVSMVIIDTLPSSMLGVEENSVREMAEVLILMRRIAHAFWCDVTFIHHGVKASWDGKPEDQRSLSAMARGTGATMGNVRAAIGLLDPTDAERGTLAGKIVAEHIAKASDGQQGYTACLYRIETAQIDVTDAITGAVVPADVPVLVALGTPAATAFSNAMTQAEEDAWIGKLTACPVRTRRYARGARDGQMGSDSVHRVLGVPNDMAWNVIDQLLKRKRVRIEVEKANRNNQDFVVVIDENEVF